MNECRKRAENNKGDEVVCVVHYICLSFVSSLQPVPELNERKAGMQTTSAGGAVPKRIEA
jgi:hypothetical protein